MKIHVKFILILAIVAFISACGSSTENQSEDENAQIEIDTAKFLTELADLESRIDNNLSVPEDKDLKEAIIKFQDFAAIFPEDPKSPDYLLKASDFSYMVGQHEKCLKILDQIIRDFPAYKRMEDVKYNRASHLDFELRDTTAAKIAYQEFIDAFPNSPLVNDCKARIPMIRYSAEELIEKFQADAAAQNQLP